jgi:hypothetical protein
LKRWIASPVLRSSSFSRSTTYYTEVRGFRRSGPVSQFGADKIRAMARTLTAHDILPLIAVLAPEERERLIRVITDKNTDAAKYQSEPPDDHEFSVDDEPLAWDAGGWDNVL